jgi:hypothetical protein
MSQGFSTPRTASGRSSTVQPLPHHISLDALHVTFRSSEDIAARFLPPGLEPVAGGPGWLMIGELSKYSAADPDQASASTHAAVTGWGATAHWFGSTATGRS